jgi:MFS family permease
MRLSLIGLAVSVFALAALDYGVTAMAQYSHVPPIVRLEAYLNTTFAVAVPISFLIGLTITASLVAARVIITELAPPNQQARVFAVSETLSEALIVAPLLFAGVGTQFAGARPVLAAVGVFLLASLLVLESRGREGLRIEPAPTLVDDPLARTLVL